METVAGSGSRGRHAVKNRQLCHQRFVHASGQAENTLPAQGAFGYRNSVPV